MTALRCTRCHDEGHLIRVAPGRLAARHLIPHSHSFGLVRLASAAANPESREDTGTPQRRVPVATAPSSRTPNRTRPAGNGRTRTVSPPGSFR